MDRLAGRLVNNGKSRISWRLQSDWWHGRHRNSPAKTVFFIEYSAPQMSPGLNVDAYIGVFGALWMWDVTLAADIRKWTFGPMVKRLALWTLNPAIAVQIRVGPVECFYFIFILSILSLSEWGESRRGPAGSFRQPILHTHPLTPIPACGGLQYIYLGCFGVY